MPGPVPLRLSRRSVLAAGLVVAASGAPGALAGCTAGSTTIAPGPTSGPKPGADETARRVAAATERLVAQMATAIATRYAANKSFAARCQDAATAHAAHSTALLEGLSAGPSATSSATGPPAIGSTALTAAANLVQAQTTAATSHQGAMDQVSGDLARLLASVAASDLAFASVLRPFASKAGA